MTQDTSTEAAWHALMNYQQADMDGIMVLVSRQAIHECKDDRVALAAERDTLAKRSKRVVEKYFKLVDRYGEKVEELNTLKAQLAEARAESELTADMLPDKIMASSQPNAVNDELNKLRLAAFMSNSEDDRSAYFDKLSIMFQRGDLIAYGLVVEAIEAGPAPHHSDDNDVLAANMPREIAAWPDFPDGCVTGSWSANQHHQDAIAYVRKEPAPRQSVQEAAIDIEAFNAMGDGEKWQHILVGYLDHLRPVPAHYVRWILAATAPKEYHFPIQCRCCLYILWLPVEDGRASLEPLRGWIGDGEGWTCPECSKKAQGDE